MHGRHSRIIGSGRGYGTIPNLYCCVAGNPTLDEAVEVTIPGTGSFRIQVCSASGQVMHNLAIDRQKESGPVRILPGKQAGWYLLRVETGNQPPKIVKVIRQ
ncbi:T9SS type A sorting domain-containing protein [Arsenicibacter rosenii]|uniref:T9SS type A sorting domain-containing protein n=1 Tax=Arsenicibacter rosenii TaxID=1750698 RepID=UPI0009F1AD83